ncbi:MAG TPA: ribosome biogenesis GTPase Der [Actinomycetota bacterium]|nr:ribosome biogenesis GTPase Der [Actinomycetota bacterium]
MNLLPKVAVVGRPNVGKSTLVNRLAGRRDSIVGPMAGLTRDRLDATIEWRDRRFILSDTGGLIEAEFASGGSDTITSKVADKALQSLKGADLVLFVVDTKTGVTSDEIALAKRLRRVGVPLVLVANKVEDALKELEVSELWSLGMGEPMPVSALHGRGSGDLLDRIVELLPEAKQDEREPEIPAIALVGRPNVGKSSLFNRIVGEERAIVHHEPGTTRDSIDTVVELDQGTFRFVDTAGIRRRAKTTGVEIYSASRTRAAIERADVTILVVTADEGATSQDQRIAEQVSEAGAAAIVALNKWDLIPDPDQAKVIERTMRDRLHFVDYAPLVRTSARTKRGVGKLLREIPTVLASREVRVPTPRLNEIVQESQQRTPIPRSRNKNVKILYATQAETAPPTFVLFGTGVVPVSWTRFLERKLREEFGFEGTPINIVTRQRSREPRS